MKCSFWQTAVLILLLPTGSSQANSACPQEKVENKTVVNMCTDVSISGVQELYLDAFLPADSAVTCNCSLWATSLVQINIDHLQLPDTHCTSELDIQCNRLQESITFTCSGEITPLYLRYLDNETVHVKLRTERGQINSTYCIGFSITALSGSMSIQCYSPNANSTSSPSPSSSTISTTSPTSSSISSPTTSLITSPTTSPPTSVSISSSVSSTIFQASSSPTSRVTKSSTNLTTIQSPSSVPSQNTSVPDVVSTSPSTSSTTLAAESTTKDKPLSSNLTPQSLSSSDDFPVAGVAGGVVAVIVIAVVVVIVVVVYRRRKKKKMDTCPRYQTFESPEKSAESSVAVNVEAGYVSHQTQNLAIHPLPSDYASVDEQAGAFSTANMVSQTPTQSTNDNVHKDPDESRLAGDEDLSELYAKVNKQKVPVVTMKGEPLPVMMDNQLYFMFDEAKKDQTPLGTGVTGDVKDIEKTEAAGSESDPTSLKLQGNLSESETGLSKSHVEETEKDQQHEHVDVFGDIYATVNKKKKPKARGTESNPLTSEEEPFGSGIRSSQLTVGESGSKNTDSECTGEKSELETGDSETKQNCYVSEVEESASKDKDSEFDNKGSDANENDFDCNVEAPESRGNCSESKENGSESNVEAPESSENCSESKENGSEYKQNGTESQANASKDAATNDVYPVGRKPKKPAKKPNLPVGTPRRLYSSKSDNKEN